MHAPELLRFLLKHGLACRSGDRLPVGKKSEAHMEGTLFPNMPLGDAEAS